MSNIEDIIIASYNENPTEVKSAFNDIMREKILAALENRINGDDLDSDENESDENAEEDSDVEVELDDNLEIDDYLDTEESEDGNT